MRLDGDIHGGLVRHKRAKRQFEGNQLVACLPTNLHIRARVVAQPGMGNTSRPAAIIGESLHHALDIRPQISRAQKIHPIVAILPCDREDQIHERAVTGLVTGVVESHRKLKIFPQENGGRHIQTHGGRRRGQRLFVGSRRDALRQRITFHSRGQRCIPQSLGRARGHSKHLPPQPQCRYEHMKPARGKKATKSAGKVRHDVSPPQ